MKLHGYHKNDGASFWNKHFKVRINEKPPIPIRVPGEFDVPKKGMKCNSMPQSATACKSLQSHLESSVCVCVFFLGLDFMPLALHHAIQSGWAQGPWPVRSRPRPSVAHSNSRPQSAAVWQNGFDQRPKGKQKTNNTSHY